VLNFQKGILAAMNENQRVLLEELRTVKHAISVLERRTRQVAPLVAPIQVRARARHVTKRRAHRRRLGFKGQGVRVLPAARRVFWEGTPGL
jgi:hypothetical protein